MEWLGILEEEATEEGEINARKKMKLYQIKEAVEKGSENNGTTRC